MYTGDQVRLQIDIVQSSEKEIMTLLDITDDIKEGRFKSKPFFSWTKLFGRRVFVRLNKVIVLGNLQYTIDQVNNLLVVFVNFNFRARKKNPDSPISLIIKEYKLSPNIDMTLFMKEVRKELLDEPQAEGFTWSFRGEHML